MSQKLKQQLIRLGHTNPSLRNHIRPVLATLTKKGGKFQKKYKDKINALRNDLVTQAAAEAKKIFEGSINAKSFQELDAHRQKYGVHIQRYYFMVKEDVKLIPGDIMPEGPVVMQTRIEFGVEDDISCKITVRDQYDDTKYVEREHPDVEGALESFDQAVNHSYR